MSTWAQWVAVSVVSLALSGCAETVRAAARQAPRAAVPVVVDETIKSLEKPETRERMGRLLATPEMRRMMRDAAAEATRGAIAGATERQASIARAVDDVVAQSTRTAVRNAAAVFPEAMAPMLKDTLVSTLNAPDVRSALDGLTAEATRTALLSSRDVIREIHEETDWPAFVTSMRRLLIGTVVAAFVLGMLAAGLVAWAASARRRSRAPGTGTGTGIAGGPSWSRPAERAPS